MSHMTSVWLVLLTAALAANLPFISQRLFLLWPRQQPKGLGLRLAELLVFYALVGALGWALEARAGQVTAQGWEFYAVTAALFVTLAFPGFVYRYLLKHRP